MDDSELDISWIREHEIISNIHNHFLRESINEINICCVYISKDNSIHRVVENTESLTMENNKTFLSQNKLLHIIQNNKKFSAIKYKLEDILVFNFDIEPEHIQQYVQNENYVDFSNTFLKKISSYDAIHISDSIIVFHSLATIYFIFKEVEREIDEPVVIKSILKKSGEKTKKHLENIEGEQKHNLTKKVVIQVDEPIVSKKSPVVNKNKTRKHHPIVIMH